MKIRSSWVKAILFVAVFFTFLFPPLMQKSAECIDFSDYKIFLSEVIQTVCVLLILFLYKSFSNKENIFLESKNFFDSKSKKISLFICSGYILLAFGALCVSSAILQGIAFFLKDVNNGTTIISPKGISWFYCILGFLFAAIYEECMYRVYVPESLHDFFDIILEKIKIKNKKVSFVLSEFLSIFIFSFAHRYLGIFAVINAIIGYIILRLCYKKTNCLFINIFAHFFYNILNLLLLI